MSLVTGEVAFEDEAGRPLLRERAGGGKTFSPVKIFGETTLMVRQELESAEGESLYGLGQHQDRLLDLAGRDLRSVPKSRSHGALFRSGPPGGTSPAVSPLC